MSAFSRVTRIVARWLLAITFVGAGMNHFRSEDFYTRIVPPMFAHPRLLVQVSGMAEIAGGICILISVLRRIAGWGLITLLLAVFPANIYMAMNPTASGAGNFPRWALYTRLPLQLLLIAWVVFAMGSSSNRATTQS